MTAVAGLVAEVILGVAGRVVGGVSGAGVSANGRVVIFGNLGGAQALFTTTELLVQTGDTIDGVTIGLPSSADINDSGTISFFAPMRDEGLMYVSVPYMMKGTIMGKPVEGAMYFDHLYFSHGIEWKEYAWSTDIQVSWNVFHNLFEDGSFEFGHIVQGAQGFSAGMVVDTKRGVTVSNHLDTDYAMDEEDCIAGASYSMKGKIWDFTADKDGRMLQFNKARWAGYRAQSGITRLRGDDRRVANGFTWLECFADRIRAQGWERK